MPVASVYNINIGRYNNNDNKLHSRGTTASIVWRQLNKTHDNKTILIIRYIVILCYLDTRTPLF